jgi:hypothetical protein
MTRAGNGMTGAAFGNFAPKQVSMIATKGSS